MTQRILENLRIDEIQTADVDALVGRRENQRLDFKEAIGSRERNNKELAHDLCAFANADGGYMVVGASEEPRDVCHHFVSVDDPEGLCQKVQQVALDTIQERILIEARTVRSSGGEEIVLICVPSPLQKPYMVAKNNHTEFWKRYDRNKRRMTIAEIRDAFFTSPSVANIHKVEAKVDTLLKRVGETDRQRIVDEVQEGDRHTLNNLTDCSKLMAAMDHFFAEAVGDRKFFRMTITPKELKGDLVDVADASILELLERPPGQRPHGWIVEPIPPISVDGFGLHSEDRDYRFLQLSRSGHLEFWTEIDGGFCWCEEVETDARGPRLSPYAVNEYPVSFLRLAAALYQKLGTKCDLTWRMQYHNIKDCVLRPLHPSVMFYKTKPELARAYTDRHFLRDTVLSADFKPDQSALVLIEEVYSAFGYQRKDIPFFDESGNFIVK
jgi:Schlafen, AlbA_2